MTQIEIIARYGAFFADRNIVAAAEVVKYLRALPAGDGEVKSEETLDGIALRFEYHRKFFLADQESLEQADLNARFLMNEWDMEDRLEAMAYAQPYLGLGVLFPVTEADYREACHAPDLPPVLLPEVRFTVTDADYRRACHAPALPALEDDFEIATGQGADEVMMNPLALDFLPL